MSPPAPPTSTALSLAVSSPTSLAPLAQSLVHSRLSTAPTLLPPHLAQLITALSLAARVSLRGSALVLEALLETLQCTTVTGLGVTRRALIAAVGSARAMHYVREGLDWSGRDDKGDKTGDTFLQVLDKWTNLGTYFIHHTFTLAELFTMSGFYLTLNTLQTGFSAAEESVRLLDSILGSNESSRALSSIITLVREELTREDPRDKDRGGRGLIEARRPGEDDDLDGGSSEGGSSAEGVGAGRGASAVSSLGALTKALTAFACLQTATHRRTLKTLKLRVVYDCTVVVEGSASSSSSSTDPSTDPLPNHAGKYAGPQAPRRQASGPTPPAPTPLQPPSFPSSSRHPPDTDPSQASPPVTPHRRAKSASALSFTPLTLSTTGVTPPTSFRGAPSERHRRRESSSSMSGEILTDVRGELEARAAARATRAAGSPSRSRRSSVFHDLASGDEGDEMDGSSVAAMDEDDLPLPLRQLHPLPDIKLQEELVFDVNSEGEGAAPTEEEIVSELEELVGCPTPPPSRARSVRSSLFGFTGLGAAEGEGYEGDEETDGAEGEEEEGDGQIPLEIELALRRIEEQYARYPSSSAASSPAASRAGSSPASPLVSPHSTAVRRPPLGEGRYSYEISISETTTTRTTTTAHVRAVDAEEDELGEGTRRRRSGVRMPGGMGLSESEGGGMGYSSSSPAAEGTLRRAQLADEDGDEDEWVSLPSRRDSPTRTRTATEESQPASAARLPGEFDLDEADFDELPSSPNGARGVGLKASLANLSRIETLERPEESRQRLQVVLSTMTKKFTQRKRTVRRFSPSPPPTASPGQSRPPFSSSSTGPLAPLTNLSVGKRRWPVSRRSSTSTTQSSSSTSTLRPSSPPPPVPAAKKTKSSASGVLKAAVSKAFRQRQQHDRPAGSSGSRDGYNSSASATSGFETAPSTGAPPTPYWSPHDERDGLDFGAPSTRSSSARPASPTASSSASLRPPSHASHPPSPSSSAAFTTHPPAGRPPIRRAASVQTLRSTVTTTCTHAPRSESEAREHAGQPSEGGPGELELGHFPHRQLIENLQRFARYSSAAYGQSFLRILGIGKHEFKFPHTQIHANNHAFAHHVGIHVEDILLSSFTDPQPAFATEKFSPIVNYVAVDHSIGAVVLACRGSLGLSDILVDLTCSYEPIPVQDADPGGAYFVHSGMFCSATALQRGAVHDVIKDALEQFPDYGLVICGHSLGGGVASLLSILWSSPVKAFQRQEAAFEEQQGQPVPHPPISTPFVTSFASGLPPGRPVSCYTYGVPCVASLDLVNYCRGLVISTVHGYDIVPTLSLGVLRDFKSMAMGFYAEQGVCEEIVGRVIGLCQRRFTAKKEAKKAAAAAAMGAAAAYAFSPFSPSASAPKDSPLRASSPPPPPLPDLSSPSFSPDELTAPPEESRLVPLTADEIEAGRGANKALEPSYQDPSLVGPDDLPADDVELSNWLWSLRTTIKAQSDNDKLYPPGTVYVVENYTVFIASESSATGKYSRREGRRVLLRAVDDVERRFSEPVFSKSMLSDHSPVHYEACCDLLATAVL
ncbi:hypothetical protein JCM8097_002215 [Rhodosporidiobolus ruineniae]